MDGEILKCKTCGAPLDIRKAVDGVITCSYCRNATILPKASPAALHFLRIGEHDLDTGKFDEAYSAFYKAWQNDKSEPEAFWGLALAEFKVQYIKDEVNNRLQPICHSVSEKNFCDNQNYKNALRLATPKQRAEYERKAAEIDYIKNEFYKFKQSGLDYDCFICVKVTGDKGERTEDSRDADYIYNLLRDNGFKPFFSERDIRNKTGADYEAMILYALYTSETMLVVCREDRYLQTPWFKNEYTRFLKLVNNEEKECDSITTVYYGSPIERLPGKNGKIQGIDFRLREAERKIINFVETHTPKARAKREEAKRRKERENEELRRQLEEQKKKYEELERKLNNSTNTVLSDEDLLERLERARQERERRAKEEEKRKAEEAERRAKEEAKRRAEQERRAKEEAERRVAQERKAKEEAERKAREEEENKFEGDTKKFYEFFKLFVTNEQIMRAKKCYDEKYGKGENSYEQTLSAMKMDGGLDNLDPEAFDDDWFDNYANNGVFITLKKMIENVNSGKDWNRDDYADVAHIYMAIENSSHKLSSQVVKKIRETFGTKAKFEVITKNVTKNTDAVRAWLFQ